ncbi:phosphopantetheine-binding protein [Asanoa sp. NPDC049518]|uniref:phosphopantetheine-binding protein n=1 Tax=unclassified Asanoa TaxID=2685164 RepID=UPI00343FCEA4
MTDTPVTVVPRGEKDLSSDYRAPGSALEQRLIEMWRQHLKVEPIGVDDDFFELGGHSLLAADLLVATEREVGVHVPASTLFLSPTIAELAEAIVGLLGDGTGA